MHKILVAILALAALPFGSAAQADGLHGVHVEDGRLVDAVGRQVLLRGVNAMDKARSWGTDTDLDPDLTDADLARIASIGFNVLRLGTSWAAIEPDPGDHDDAYVDRFLGLLDRLHAHRLVAVVDMHQDVYSEGVGSNGAPAWADPQCNVPPHADLSGATGQWFADYFSPTVQAAWSNFWADGYGDADVHCTGRIQTRFVEMWRHLASRLSGHPAVVGYDLLNEPWPGSPPPAFEALQLYPFYRRVATAIRSVDPDTPIFFEPSIQHSAGLPSPPLGPPDPNAVYAPHVYGETMYSQGAITTSGATEEQMLVRDAVDAAVMGVPTWVGEWGAFENDRSQAYQRVVYEALDRHRVGGAYWHYTQGASDGMRDRPEADVGHVRVYPEAYPGEATWRFDPDSRVFTMDLAVEHGAPPAIVVVPARLYPDGFTVEGAHAGYDATAQRLSWEPGPGRHTLRISPA